MTVELIIFNDYIWCQSVGTASINPLWQSVPTSSTQPGTQVAEAWLSVEEGHTPISKQHVGFKEISKTPSTGRRGHEDA